SSASVPVASKPSRVRTSISRRSAPSRRSTRCSPPSPTPSSARAATSRPHKGLAEPVSGVLAEHHVQGYDSVDGRPLESAVMLQYDLHRPPRFEDGVLVDHRIDDSVDQQMPSDRRKV